MRVTLILLTWTLGIGTIPAIAAEEGAPQEAALAQASPAEALKGAQSLFQAGQYFKAARYAFSAKEDSALSAEANAWITVSLARARLYHSASYFFIKSLQSRNPSAVRRALTVSQDLLLHVGVDLLRKYLIQNTKFEDYDSSNRAAYYYALGKDALMAGDEQKAIGFLSNVGSRNPLMPYALQLRATAYAVMGQSDHALRDFRNCERSVDDAIPSSLRGTVRGRQIESEAEDLEARCQAGQARVLYQQEKFDEADRAFDRIDKRSIVWPDILFEQAWTSFARREFNRSLGKLVSYKSPALAFVYNPEVEVLRAQSYLLLCLYSDANDEINGFNSRYAPLGEQLKNFIEGNSSNLNAFYELGREAIRGSAYSRREIYRLTNRFARAPYFRGLARSETSIANELSAIRQFSAGMSGVDPDLSRGFPGFLDQVLRWRLKTVRQIGGAYIKNSLIDNYQVLLANFDKMSFIKLEMLKRAKDSILKRPSHEGRSWGSVEPSRRDYQYYWSFNGEFWNDELGDYVFGLESECKGSEASG